MRLGEILLHKGLINPAQLKEALDAQLIYGGHLGTCLIELGHLDEQRLGSELAEVAGVGYADHALFQEIPRYVVSTLPEKLVEKHLAIPFRLREKTLDVAMIDPKDLLALDELSFAAGYRLQPWIAPEVRIFQAMERYYDIPRRLRYITLAKQIDRSAQAMHVVPLAVAAAAAPPLARTAPAPPSPASAPASAPREREVKRDPLEQVSSLLAAASTRDKLAEVVLDFVASQIPRCVLFKVKDGTGSIWKSAGVAFNSATLTSFSFQVTEEPVFSLLQGEELYRGGLPREGRYRDFYETLDLVMPQDVLLLPVYLDDRLVLLFYGDGGPDGRVQGETDTYRRLLRKLALALSVVILKRKIVLV